MISLILPTYNAEARIASTWHAVAEFVEAHSEPWEVLFVLDGCTDDTATVLDRLQEDFPHPSLHVLGYPRNRGKGFAVRYGLLQATGDIRAFTDVDLAYDFDDIDSIVAGVQDRTPFVMASRAHPDSLLLIPDRMLGYAFRRKVQSVSFRRAAATLLDLNFRDTQAGLKAMTGDVVEHLVPHLNCDGFGFDCELLLAAKRAGIRVAERPVRVRYEEGTTTSTMTGFRMLRELWSIRKDWKQKPMPLFVPSVREEALFAKAA